MTAFGEECPKSFAGKRIIGKPRYAKEAEAIRNCPLADTGGKAGHPQKSRSAYCGPGAMPLTVSASSGRNDGLDFIL